MDIFSLIIGFVVGIMIGSVALGALLGKKLRSAETEREKAKSDLEHYKASLDTAKKEIRIEAEQEASSKLQKRIAVFERDVKETRSEFKNTERRLDKREDMLDKKESETRNREKQILAREQKLDERRVEYEKKHEKLDRMIEQEEAELFRISELSREEAERKILKRIETELGSEIGELVSRAMEKVEETVDEKSREILVAAIQRYSGDHVSEVLVSTVDLPSDEMKGRIIGREGRNIRTFEKATGTDVVVDDTPGLVVVSAFDPVRREIARRSMEKLIQDGRIHPGRIEEVVERTRQEMLAELQKTGAAVFQEVGLRKAHPKIVMMLGRLKYRSSYGQNVLKHSKEVAALMGMVASELGLNANLARRCGLLHDIGKAIDHESEGTHTELGMEAARRYGEAPEVINAIGSHHEQIDPDNVYSILVKVMDSISAGRPGARSETLEKYLKRLEKLEFIATTSKGVAQAFAIQAGREIRVIINADSVGDKEVFKICRDIAAQIEKELTYPGEIKVTCIRETRVIEVAR